MERMTGTVSKIILTRGFGFIVGDDDAEDYMMHVDDLRENTIRWESIHKGTRLSFIPTKSKKANGLCAKDVAPE